MDKTEDELKDLDGEELIKAYEKQKEDEAEKLAFKRRNPIFHLSQLDMSLDQLKKKKSTAANKKTKQKKQLKNKKSQKKQAAV